MSDALITLPSGDLAAQQRRLTPWVVRVVAPFSTGTVLEALREIRGNVAVERNTLEGLSTAIDTVNTRIDGVVDDVFLDTLIYG